jgi:hypothetical protein
VWISATGRCVSDGEFVKKLASQVRRGDRVLIDGEKHVSIAPALQTYRGVTVCTVPDGDRSADETYTSFEDSDDVETW